MVDSAQALLKSWEEGIDKNGGTIDIKIDDDIRAYSADVISRTCFGSSYIKGKNIFLKIRELQKAVSKPNVLAEMTGLRLATKYVISLVQEYKLKLLSVPDNMLKLPFQFSCKR